MVSPQTPTKKHLTHVLSRCLSMCCLVLCCLVLSCPVLSWCPLHAAASWTLCMCQPGEVDNPSRTFPRALLWAVLLVVASYFLPTLAALGVTVDSSDWQLGYYGKVAQQVCGRHG